MRIVALPIPNGEPKQTSIPLIQVWWPSNATYAPEYSTYETSQNRSGAAAFCNATLGFGLPASTGKPFVDKLWSAAIPNHDYWNGTLYLLGLLHVSGTFHLYY
jgi:hypothetical protein